MNRLLVASFFALILILSACSSNNEESTAEAENEVTSTEEETDGELSEIEKENEELREELAKKENEELKSELEDEESEESNEDNNDEEEQTQDEVKNDSEENNNNESLALTVDECVLALFEDDCHENFPKQEVQDTFLEYAEAGEVPYEGGGGSQSLEYVVASVQYYDEHGEFPELDEIEVDNELEVEDYEEYRVAIVDYLEKLTNYYNVGHTSGDAIFEYLKEGNPAYDKIWDNKESGYFAHHVTHDIFVGHMYPQDDGTITIEVTRTYEHANSNGVEDAVVTYIMDMETHEIIDFN